MPQPVKPSRRRLGLAPLFAGAVLLFALLAAGGFAFAASQETHDPFCASCHTQPESTFYQQSTAAQPVDLASYHAGKQTLCINCHSGPGVLGRAQAELMGARNAFKWYSGTAVQPARLTYPIGDGNCLKCHPDVTSRQFVPKQQISLGGRNLSSRRGEGGNNHWHQLLARWQASAPAAGRCVSCHGSHEAGSTVQAGFMNAQQVQSTCDACHRVLRQGDED